MCSHATRLRPSCIMPPHILREIAQRGNPAQRAAATNTLALDATFRTLRASPLAVRPRSTCASSSGSGREAPDDLHRREPAAAPGSDRRDRTEAADQSV